MSSDITIFNFMKRLNPRTKLWLFEATEKIYSEKEFRKIVDIERARVDRMGNCFSVVSFVTSNKKGNGVFKKQLISILKKKLRTTDEIGLIDEDRIGVLLHNAPPDATGDFVNRLREDIGSEISLNDYEIYTYPTNQNDMGSNSKNSKKHCRRINFRKKVNENSKQSFSTINSSTSEPTAISPHSKRVPTLANTEYVQQITPLFCKKIPIWKRCLDITGAVTGLIILSPVFMIIAILIKIVSPGPVFFKQERVGCYGKRFIFWKFRTMPHNISTEKHQQYLATLIHDSENTPMAKIDEELHIIPFGNFLRKSCLDELPQLFNVLRGDMSLVGPRPPIPYEVEEYKNWHNGRLDTVPGMTGPWQVSGKNRLTFLEMVRLDIRYTKHINFFSEIKILLMTPIAIILLLVNSGQNK